ncbi:MAG: hypothetical protein O2892_17265 [Actinomycetota bacterium]|nr:hypothetical protein [Actinomycetota bacterium]MDA2950764.1 hypothetical protein [Actinomycetota bacterium]
MTTTHDTVPVPAGTAADDWQPDNWRVVFSPRRSIPGREDINVALTAVQFADGRIDDGSEFEPPQVYVDHPDGLTAAQARSLAGLLIEAAETLDGWTGTPSWRAMSDRLTPEQSRHLAAVERLALDNADNPVMRGTAGETLDALPDEARTYADANPRPGLLREDFRLRKVPAGWRIAQRVGSGWELLSDVYQSRADANLFIARAVEDEPPFM